jgi:class 3 adenylate cyclase
MLIDPPLRQALARVTPTTLLDRLADPDAPLSILTETLQHLNSLRKSVASFLPLYLTDDETILDTHFRALSLGTFMFADVSGFTALSEQLQNRNSEEGAENLTIIINEFFAQMLEILANCDGMLLKFAGDALLAFFPASDESTHDAGRAVRTALRMQRAMSQFQPIRDARLVALLGGEDMSLTMSIGLERGELFEALVGNAIQREHIIQGALPDAAMNAEAVGVRDDVIVTDNLASILASTFTLKPLRPGFFQVIDDIGENLGNYEVNPVRRRRPKATAVYLEPDNILDHLHEQVTRLQSVARYVSPAVLHELVNSGNYHVRSENRTVTILFIYASGFADLLDSWGHEHLDQIGILLERYYNLVHQIATSAGGVVTRTDPYQRGIKILIAFGALVAHEDDPQRAAEVALDLVRSVQHFNERLSASLPPGVTTMPHISQRIGITQGRTYSGEVGWKARREYTVMGDDVNLAARLMACAEDGQILVSERVQRRLSGLFVTRTAGKQRIKGKREPLTIYQVTGEAPAHLDAPENDSPIIGHDLIVHTLTLALRQTLQTQHVEAAALVGESGSGKTRVAREIVRLAKALGFRTAWTTCTPRASRRTTWDNILNSLLELDSDLPLEARRARLHEWLVRLDLVDLEVSLSLLCFSTEIEFVDENEPVTDDIDQLVQFYEQTLNKSTADPRRSTGMFLRAYQQLDGKSAPERSSRNVWLRMQKRISVNETVARLLYRLSQETPILLVINALEHENTSALSVLRYILEQLEPARLMILLTWEYPYEFDLPIQHIVIPDLSHEETRLMAMELLDVRELSDHLSNILWERTGGRPLFIESFLRHLIENNYLVRDQFQADLAPGAVIDVLPENIRELMISRFDRLPSGVQTVIRAASIFNGEFSREMLGELIASSGERLERPLDELLQQSDIRLILETTENGAFLFRNQAMQEAVYGNLPRIQRLKLHRAAAALWRKQVQSDEQILALAHHLAMSGLLPEAVEVVMNAADRALELDDADSAIELYTHALTLFPDEKSIRLQLERLRHEMAG